MPMAITIPSPLTAFKAALSAYRSLTQSDWAAVLKDGRFQMRRWTGKEFEYRECSEDEALDADWNHRIK